MDLQKIINETLAGINATVRFLGEFGSTIFKLTFRPRVFIDSFAASAGRDHRQKTAAAFLFTLLLLVELSVGIFERVRDAYSSMSDVGIGVVLQADSIWELSSDVLVRR